MQRDDDGQRVRASSRREGDQLRHELLAAASRLAAVPRPVSMPSLRAVASACGVSPTAVYRHFSSQAALTHAVLLSQSQAFERTVLLSDEPALDPVERLRRLGRGYVRWGTDNPGTYQLLFESAEQLPFERTHPDPSRELMSRIVTLLDARPAVVAPKGTGVASATAQALAEQLWTCLHGLVSLRLHKPQHAWTIGDEQATDDILLRVLQADAASSPVEE